MFATFIICVFIGLIPLGEGEYCVSKYYEEDSFVCVCNLEDGCGFIGQLGYDNPQQYTLVTSTRDELRFELSYGNITSNTGGNVSVSLVLDPTSLKQKIFGFGGAFTDATGIAVTSLPEDVQEMIMRSYFSPDGLEYNIGRIPIAGSDFSTHPYSYDDVEGDVGLINFNLTSEDYLYKIPLIKTAFGMSERPLLLFASPWSPPSWMKDNQMFNGTGGLLDEMRQPWANYFIKFLDSYAEEGISMWGLTAQNEPSMGYINDHHWNACGFSPSKQRDFVRDYLGPTLASSGYLPNLQLMVTDDSRDTFPIYPETVLSDPLAYEYTSGIAVHWYGDKAVPPLVLNTIHNDFPEKFLLYTEACTGLLNHQVQLGSWSRGEDYATNIIEDLNHWVSGWTDWNMALDEIGGPNWAFNFVDSPIIVNATGGEFYKQPMFYAMGHFSKFIPENSYAISFEMIEADDTNQRIDATAILTPDDMIVVVLVNRNEESKSVGIQNGENHVYIDIPSKSFQTVIFNN